MDKTTQTVLIVALVGVAGYFAYQAFAPQRAPSGATAASDTYGGGVGSNGTKPPVPGTSGGGFFGRLGSAVDTGRELYGEAAALWDRLT